MQQHTFICIFALLLNFIIQPDACATKRVSISSSAVQGDLVSNRPSISENGRFIAFQSNASNLVAGDTNNLTDTFVHDQMTGATQRVSISSTGVQGNGRSYTPSISGSGRFVAFASESTNLVNGDTNNKTDIFIHDRTTGLTERVSVSTTGSQSNDFSHYPSISFDGRVVAFRSSANNLVSDDTNGDRDIFIHDRTTRFTERVSVSSPRGIKENSDADSPSISADGLVVVFSAFDVRGIRNIFVHDRSTGITERVSMTPNGHEPNAYSYTPTINANGRIVAFRSWASNLVDDDTNHTADIFTYDRITRVTQRVSISSTGVQGNDSSSNPSISGNGQFVAFSSDSNSLVADDTNNRFDIFIHDRTTRMTQRVSMSSTGIQGNGHSYTSSVSGDGHLVAFLSFANNLVADDTNKTRDVFVNSIGSSNSQLSVVVKPSSDVAQIGEKRRFQAEITNRTDQILTNCIVSVVRPVFSNGQRQFNYYFWSWESINPIANAPIDIEASDTATIFLVVIPRVAMQREIQFKYICDNTQALIIPFENSILFTSKNTPLIAEDYIKLDNDNRKTELVIDQNSTNHWSTYVVSVKNTGTKAASINLSTTITVSSSQLRTTKLCETESNASYRCINPLTNQLQVELDSGQSRKIIVFAHADKTITKNPVFNRIYLEARDQSGVIVAKNSIGVYTVN